MKRTMLCVLLFVMPTLLSAQGRARREGVIIRMRMADCLGPQHGFMAAMAGGGKVEAGALAQNTYW